MVLSADEDRRIRESMGCMDERGILIVKDLWRCHQFWQQIIDDKRSRVMFDLYYCGIVFFDTKREKRNYIINF